jgi:LacI family transcriptional regulator
VVPSFATVAYTRIVRGAIGRGIDRDVAVLLLEDAATPDIGQVVDQLLRSGRIDGVAVASAHPGDPLQSALSRRGAPHVFVNRAVAGSGRNVTMDEDAASAAVVEHLVGLGHRRLAHIAGPGDIDPAARRWASLRRYAAERGLPAPAVVEAPFSEEGGYDAARRLLLEHPEITAIYTSALGLTIGAIRAIADSGREVPADVSVIGYDEMPVAAYLRPSATTVRMPFEELGGAAVDGLLAQIGGAQPADVVVDTRPEIVVRESTGRAPRQPSTR